MTWDDKRSKGPHSLWNQYCGELVLRWLHFYSPNIMFIISLIVQAMRSSDTEIQPKSTPLYYLETLYAQMLLLTARTCVLGGATVEILENDCKIVDTGFPPTMLQHEYTREDVEEELRRTTAEREEATCIKSEARKGVILFILPWRF